MGILVIGSFMMDVIVRTPRAPQNGETIIGKNFSQLPGGKGANQAVAAARLGGKVIMAGKVGTDEFGKRALSTLQKENVDIQYMQQDRKHPTGIGFITLEENGNNRIIVVPGANMNFNVHDLDTIKSLIRNAEIIVLQLEMDLEMIEQAVSYAASFEVPVILNPAPAQYLSDSVLRKITYLTPNETEAEILTGVKINSLQDAEEAGRILIEKGVKNVIITLAEKGSLIVTEKEICHIPGYHVDLVDSVAAGDSFNGALAVGITEGKPLQEVVKFANAVGALTVTKEGAIPSLPSYDDVKDFMGKIKN